MKYAYLVASLPSLSFGTSPPYSKEAFLERCSEQLSDNDYAEIDHLLNRKIDDCRSPYVLKWQHFDTALRQAIAEVRAGRTGQDPRPFKDIDIQYFADVKRAVVNAFAKSNPRNREEVLDQTRWQFLEELGKEDPFNMGYLVAYSLQLHLLEKHRKYMKVTGNHIFETETQQVLNTFQQAEPI